MHPFQIHTLSDEDSGGNVISFITSDFIDGNTDIDESHLKGLLPILPLRNTIIFREVRSPFPWAEKNR